MRDGGVKYTEDSKDETSETEPTFCLHQNFTSVMRHPPFWIILHM